MSLKRKQDVSPPSSPPALSTLKATKRQRTLATPTSSPPIKRTSLDRTKDKENVPMQKKPRKMVTKEKEPTPLLRVKRLSKDAKLPTRGSSRAAGYDLYSAKDVVIPAQGKVLVPTDISIGIPSGCYGRVAPRSGLALKFFLDTGAGVIDEDYRGPLGVVMFNFSKTDYEVKAGERIAQLILERIYTPEVVEVDSLEDTDRGVEGFGSTGKQ